jgi:hypothetical protein
MKIGNLGLYQVMTTVAGAVGGPVVLTAGLLVGGYLAGKAIEKGIKNLKDRKNVQYGTCPKFYK